MTHEELQALAGAYALGALDGEELQAFREHLPACWECRQQVLEFEEVYAEGSLALPPVKPDPALKGKLLARISGQGPALPPAPAPAPTVGPAQAAARSGAASSDAGLPPWVGLLLLGLALSALACASLWLSARARAAGLEARLQALESQGDERMALAAQVARLEGDWRQAHERLERLAIELQVWRRLLREPEARVEALRGTEAAPGAVGRVLWHGNQVALVAERLPQLPPGQVYALWALEGERKLLAGLFPHAAEGSTLVGLAALPAAVPAGVQAFALTPEPEGGGEAPTGQVVLLGQVQ